MPAESVAAHSTINAALTTTILQGLSEVFYAILVTGV